MNFSVFALLLLFLAACSLAPSAPDNEHPPSWATGSTRTVDGGYVIYVGVGEDRSFDKAQFKATAMALQDLANECSMAPKGARIEDHYDQTVGILHRAYAKVAVEFQVCEAAKNAVTPEQIRTLASVPMTEEIKNYQEAYDEPEDEESSNPMVASSASPNPSGSPEPSGNGGFRSGVYVASVPQYYVVSQQVAFIKQDVILAPPAQYPPQAPVFTRPVPAVIPAQQGINQYLASNPSLRVSTQAFSGGRPNWQAHQASMLRQPIAVRQQTGMGRGISGGNSFGRTQSGSLNGSQQRKRRKRYGR
ncbi:MAG: hypothetical protein P4M08_06620 [Oligoflexia bacterium]|nr:hypothetical protein [Oligoflexia bacterium]